jgi:hypothetical protein
VGGEFSIEVMNIAKPFIIYFKFATQNDVVVVVAATACYVPWRQEALVILAAKP